MSEKSTLMLEKSTLMLEKSIYVVYIGYVRVVYVEHTWCMLNIRYVCLVNSVAWCWFGIRGSPYMLSVVYMVYV